MSDAPDSSAPRELAVWEYAGLLLTYWCNARCEFCYVCSGPEHARWMRPDDALSIWRSLDRLATRRGAAMRIHLAGGEPFGDWPRLLSIVRAARDAGLPPLEKIETNAYWATSDGATRARIEQLAALGVEMLFVSADVYHQQFVPFDRVRRCVEIARDVLGRGRVRVRWWDFFNNPIETRKLSREDRRRLCQLALEHHPERITGRAADELASLRPLHAAAHFREQNCVEAILRSRHVHIDPYGAVFPGVCNGIILGNAIAESVETLWERLASGWREHPVVSAVVAGGSYELMRHAARLGYRELDAGYADKCHLCHHVRRFLFDRGVWPDCIGPAECYGRAEKAEPRA